MEVLKIKFENLIWRLKWLKIRNFESYFKKTICENVWDQKENGHIYSRMAHKKNLPLTSLPCKWFPSKQIIIKENHNGSKSLHFGDWFWKLILDGIGIRGVREMNGFIGIRWCRLVREVDMHLMRRLGRMFKDVCMWMRIGMNEWEMGLQPHPHSRTSKGLGGWTGH